MNDVAAMSLEKHTPLEQLKPLILLSTAYLPSVRYFTKFLLPGYVVIEDDENYLKQSYRNRCIVAGPNGPQALVVPVKRGSFHKTHIRDIVVEDTLPWLTGHLHTLKAAYRSSPFYDYYIDDLAKVLRKNRHFLLDLNLNLLKALFTMLDINTPFSLTGKYYQPQDNKHVLDYRETIHPKKKAPDSLYQPIVYHQVFDDRYGFLPDLSIIDLIFNEGPDALPILQKCLVSKTRDASH